MIEIAHACPYCGVSPAKMYQMWTAKVVFALVKEGVAAIKVPIAKTRAALSPIVLPIERIVAFKIPSIELGKIILNIVSECDAPRAKEALIILLGIVFIDSSTVLTIVGSKIRVKVKAPVKTFPRNKYCSTY